VSHGSDGHEYLVCHFPYGWLGCEMGAGATSMTSSAIWSEYAPCTV
jgi:hypothetical protein